MGYEYIFDEHKHNTIGLVGTYRPIDRLSFSISPGVAFEQHIDLEIHPAVHGEVAYEFEIGDLHLGPVFEIAYDTEDIHLSLGLHLGLGFSKGMHDPKN